MPKSRKADYHICCNEGAVYIDFDEQPNGRIKLIRISFDGHGCYEVNEELNEMRMQDSYLFRKMMIHKEIDQEEMNRILCAYFFENKGLMQYDAMTEYGLISET